jgi:hypothetical protein
VGLDDYAEISEALRAKLRWEQAAIGQLPDLPSSSRVYRLALRLEVLRRLTAAVHARDLAQLRRLDGLACKILVNHSRHSGV